MFEVPCVDLFFGWFVGGCVCLFVCLCECINQSIENKSVSRGHKKQIGEEEVEEARRRRRRPMGRRYIIHYVHNLEDHFNQNSEFILYY